MAAEKARNRHVGWLLLLMPAALVAYGGVALAQLSCRCVAWYSAVLTPQSDTATSTAIVIVLALALALVALGLLGAWGFLPRAPARGAKVRVAVGVPGLIWSGYLMLAIYVRFFDPWYSLYWVAGFLASSFILWLVLFVGDTIRHALSPAAAGRKGTSSG